MEMAKRRVEIPTFFAGHLLAAMPGMPDPRFARTVIYMCAHTKDGAMGLVINKPFTQLSFPDLLDQLGIKAPPRAKAIRLRSGGPVESGRGFVLHSDDYMHEGTMPVLEGIALTATVDILKAMAEGGGPRRSLLALGYANWGPGQLENELTGNGWLTVPVDDDIVFDAELGTKWERALVKAGAHPSFLSGEAGHA
jgi:putative transcriptional regulator